MAKKKGHRRQKGVSKVVGYAKTAAPVIIGLMGSGIVPAAAITGIQKGNTVAFELNEAVKRIDMGRSATAVLLFVGSKWAIKNLL